MTRVTPAAERSGADLAGAVVVVVEDDRLQLLALRLVLEDWGCVAVAAPTVEEALADLSGRSLRPDVALADFRLAGPMGGVEALAALRGAHGAELPALLLTGETGPEVVEQTAAQGIEVLHKPIHPNRLRDVIAAALAGRG